MADLWNNMVTSVVILVEAAIMQPIRRSNTVKIPFGKNQGKEIESLSIEDLESELEFFSNDAADHPLNQERIDAIMAELIVRGNLNESEVTDGKADTEVANEIAFLAVGPLFDFTMENAIVRAKEKIRTENRAPLSTVQRRNRAATKALAIDLVPAMARQLADRFRKETA